MVDRERVLYEIVLRNRSLVPNGVILNMQPEGSTQRKRWVFPRLNQQCEARGKARPSLGGDEELTVQERFKVTGPAASDETWKRRGTIRGGAVREGLEGTLDVRKTF